MSDFTPEQVERAADVLWDATGKSVKRIAWRDLAMSSKVIWLACAEKILSAAGAPEKVTPVVDEAALAEVRREAAVKALREAHADLVAYTDSGAPFSGGRLEDFLLRRADEIEKG